MRRISPIITVAATLTLTSCTSVRQPPADDREPPAPRIVVDAAGFTLYRFERQPRPVPSQGTAHGVDPDDERRRRNCDGGTPAGWPLVRHRSGITLPGVDPRRIGSLERPDGTLQLAINGCPVYRYAGDRAPGQAEGDGLGGEWFAIRA